MEVEGVGLVKKNQQVDKLHFISKYMYLHFWRKGFDAKMQKKTEIVEDQQENREASFFGWIKKHVDLSSSTAACRGEGKVMDTL